MTISLGEIRTSQVWVFELKKKKWSKLIEDKNGDARCDPPVGLSGQQSNCHKHRKIKRFCKIVSIFRSYSNSSEL